MQLTPAQLTALKADLAANTSTVLVAGVATQIKNVAALANRNDIAPDVAAWYNLEAAGPYWLWKTVIFESEITRSPSSDATNWDWTAYIARSQGERDAWARLFMGGGSGMNPSLTNVRQGLADIFSGSANNAAAQRTHLLATCRRKATNAEKLFVVAATGPGNDGVGGNRGLTTNPDAPGAALNGATAEGPLTGANVTAAWNS